MYMYIDFYMYDKNKIDEAYTSFMVVLNLRVKLNNKNIYTADVLSAQLSLYVYFF